MSTSRPPLPPEADISWHHSNVCYWPMLSKKDFEGVSEQY